MPPPSRPPPSTYVPLSDFQYPPRPTSPRHNANITITTLPPSDLLDDDDDDDDDTFLADTFRSADDDRGDHPRHHTPTRQHHPPSPRRRTSSPRRAGGIMPPPLLHSPSGSGFRTSPVKVQPTSSTSSTPPRRTSYLDDHSHPDADANHSTVVALLSGAGHHHHHHNQPHPGYGDKDGIESVHFRSAEKLPEQEFLNLLLHQTSLDDAQELCRARLDYLFESDDARKLQRTPFYRIALFRFPAIVLTLCLELVVAAIISSYADVITAQPRLSAFIPVLSSISGNVGLQASTTTLRALATGHASNSNLQGVLRVMLREFLTATLIALTAAAVLLPIAHTWSDSWPFGLITATAILLSSSLAGIIGSTGPLLFKRLGIDPALTAGPFETAVQDCVGVSVYLGLAAAWGFG